MAVYHVEVREENVGLLRRYTHLKRVFDPDAETELLRLDMAIATRRYGRNRKRIAEYLLAGREHWGYMNTEGG